MSEVYTLPLFLDLSWGPELSAAIALYAEFRSHQYELNVWRIVIIHPHGVVIVVVLSIYKWVKLGFLHCCCSSNATMGIYWWQSNYCRYHSAYLTELISLSQTHHAINYQQMDCTVAGSLWVLMYSLRQGNWTNLQPAEQECSQSLGVISEWTCCYCETVWSYGWL